MIVPSIERNGETIALTDLEAYGIFKYYSTKFRMPEVKAFIQERLNLETKEILTEDECYALAGEYENETQKGFTDCYAMAQVVIPYLKKKGVEVKKRIEDFISCSEI